MTNAKAIMNFVYFCTNYDYKFIEKAWEDDPHLMEHLRNKFNDIANPDNGYGRIVKFFLELDHKNQDKLANWITENYTAFPYFKEDIKITNDEDLKFLYQRFSAMFDTNIMVFDGEHSEIDRSKNFKHFGDYFLENLSYMYHVQVYTLNDYDGLVGFYTKKPKFERNNKI